MIKTLLTASSIILALPLLAGPAAAGASWTSVGKAQLPTFGSAQIYLDRAAEKRPGMRAGKLRAVLDEPWQNPDASGFFDEVEFRVLANCQAGTFALQPTWPEGPDTTAIRERDLKRPALGSTNEKLLKAVCG